VSFQETWPSTGFNNIGCWELAVSFESNGSSDPAATSWTGGHLLSITRNADGDWSLDLASKDFIFKVLSADVSVLQSSDGSGTTYLGEAYVDETATNGTSVRVFTKTTAGTKTNPGTGRRIFVRLLVTSSGIGYSYT